MTPLQIEVLLHYHTCPLPHPRINAPAVESAISWLAGQGIITQSLEINCYHTTERGKAMVMMLCSLPFPVKKWTDQNGNIIKLPCS